MDAPRGHNHTVELLSAWRRGDHAARDQLMTLLYDELRRVAHAQMRGERPGHVFQTTALVHEAYLRLADLNALDWRDRAHFIAMAATTMRRILVDEARSRDRQKRGGGITVTSLDSAIAARESSVDVLAVNDALDRLAVLDPRQARVVELRFFTGLSIEETAAVLEMSPASVKRDWATAKLWLYREISHE
jgi:RNA polymerase sigma factor (TIGR02999 family)